LEAIRDNKKTMTFWETLMRIQIVIVAVLTCLCWTCPLRSAFGGDAKAQSEIVIGSGELAVILGATPSPAEKRAAELLAERARERSGVSIVDADATTSSSSPAASAIRTRSVGNRRGW
jgi:hypothetical protein